MTSKTGDLLIQFKEIFAKVEIKIDHIFEILNPFLAEHRTQLSQELLRDINKIQDKCLLLKQEIGKYSRVHFSEMIAVDFPQIRHNVRNHVNPILGYTELLIEQFKKNSLPLEPFKHIQEIIGQILKLVDLMKIVSTGQSCLSNTNIGSHDYSDDFKQFREKFPILIVDDNEENCLLLQRYLDRNGFTNTRIAYDGKQALALKDSAELILLDIDMPKMSGIEVLQHIKEEIIQGKLMVLMISAADTMANIIECIKGGAEDFLSKPFDPDLLNVRINTCIEKKWARAQQATYREKLMYEKNRYETLLNSVFPPAIVKELTETGKVQAANYRNVAVLFADIVSFTQYCSTHETTEIIDNLQEFAGLCEKIAIKNEVQKIKTIGDCFLGVSGMLTPSENPVLDCLNFAEEVLASMNQMKAKWQLRIGIHYGTVIGGIVGHKQYLFDIWGDTVNTASRIQKEAEPNRIFLSKNAWEQVNTLCSGDSLGTQKIKGKEPMEIVMFTRKQH